MISSALALPAHSSQRRRAKPNSGGRRRTCHHVPHVASRLVRRLTRIITTTAVLGVSTFLFCPSPSISNISNPSAPLIHPFCNQP